MATTRKPKHEIISDTGIVTADSNNGAREQRIIFRLGKTKFRISIRSESYDFQSYVKLMQWTDKEGWEVIEARQPKRDFEIDIAYKHNYKRDAFLPMIQWATRLAEKFVD